MKNLILLMTLIVFSFGAQAQRKVSCFFDLVDKANTHSKKRVEGELKKKMRVELGEYRFSLKVKEDNGAYVVRGLKLKGHRTGNGKSVEHVLRLEKYDDQYQIYSLELESDSQSDLLSIIAECMAL